METASTKRIKSWRAPPVLPEEIVEDILSRLPSKSVMRFRCVSRSWAAMLSSPAFLDLHQRRARAGRAKLFFIPDPAKPDERFYSCDLGGGLPPEVILNTADHFPAKTMVFPITKSCHGLVLLCCMRIAPIRSSSQFLGHYVWNPSTGEIMALPERERTMWGDVQFSYYGMGYCATAKRHKVVRMFNGIRGNIHDATNVIKCEVFTLGDDSAFWRPAASEPPVGELFHIANQGVVFCNGNLHLLRKDGFITTFNVRDETFGILPPPPEFYCEALAEIGHVAAEFNMTELDGNLCAFEARCGSDLVELELDPPNPYYNSYPIWLLRDHEAGGRWEILRCIDWATITKDERKQLESEWMAPLDMYHDGSGRKMKIMFGTSSCKVFVADPVTGVPEVLFSAGACGGGDVFPTMGLFEESLVPVGRTTEENHMNSSLTQTVGDPQLA